MSSGEDIGDVIPGLERTIHRTSAPQDGKRRKMMRLVRHSCLRAHRTLISTVFYPLAERAMLAAGRKFAVMRTKTRLLPGALIAKPTESVSSLGTVYLIHPEIPSECTFVGAGTKNRAPPKGQG